MWHKCIADIFPEVLSLWNNRCTIPPQNMPFEILPLEKIIDPQSLAPQEKFLDYLLSKKLSTRTTQGLYNFFTFGAENIYQHANGQGLCGLYATTRNIFAFMYDIGPGITDQNGDGIPDILEALQEEVSLGTNGCIGLGLTYTARSVDQLFLHTNGYLWHKSGPKHIREITPRVSGVLLWGRISR